MRHLLAWMLVALSADASAHAQQPPWSLLIQSAQHGDYHGDEAPARPGSGWLALVRVQSQWHLLATSVSAERVFDPVLDADGETTGLRIGSTHADAIALLRLPSLKPGMIAVSNLDDARTPLAEAAPLAISFAGDEYVVEVTGDEVSLRKSLVRTRLDALTVGGPRSEDSANVLWAGDLDGDGALDLLVNAFGSNRSGTCLYLSGAATPGALVGLVACHSGVGC